MFLSVLANVTKASFLFCFLDVFKRVYNRFEETFFFTALSQLSVFFSSFLFHLARMHGEGASYYGSSYLFSDKNKSKNTSSLPSF